MKPGDKVVNQYGKKGIVTKSTDKELVVKVRGFYRSNSYDVWKKE